MSQVSIYANLQVRHTSEKLVKETPGWVQYLESKTPIIECLKNERLISVKDKCKKTSNWESLNFAAGKEETSWELHP